MHIKIPTTNKSFIASIIKGMISREINKRVNKDALQSACNWLEREFSTLDAGDKLVIAQALWNGYISSETEIPQDLRNWLEKYL